MRGVVRFVVFLMVLVWIITETTLRIVFDLLLRKYGLLRRDLQLFRYAIQYKFIPYRTNPRRYASIAAATLPVDTGLFGQVLAIAYRPEELTIDILLHELVHIFQMRAQENRSMAPLRLISYFEWLDYSELSELELAELEAYFVQGIVTREVDELIGNTRDESYFRWLFQTVNAPELYAEAFLSGYALEEELRQQALELYDFTL